MIPRLIFEADSSGLGPLSSNLPVVCVCVCVCVCERERERERVVCIPLRVFRYVMFL